METIHRLRTIRFMEPLATSKNASEVNTEPRYFCAKSNLQLHDTAIRKNNKEIPKPRSNIKGNDTASNAQHNIRTINKFARQNDSQKNQKPIDNIYISKPLRIVCNRAKEQLSTFCDNESNSVTKTFPRNTCANDLKLQWSRTLTLNNVKRRNDGRKKVRSKVYLKASSYSMKRKQAKINITKRSNVARRNEPITLFRSSQVLNRYASSSKNKVAKLLNNQPSYKFGKTMSNKIVSMFPWSRSVYPRSLVKNYIFCTKDGSGAYRPTSIRYGIANSKPSFDHLLHLNQNFTCNFLCTDAIPNHKHKYDDLSQKKCLKEKKVLNSDFTTPGVLMKYPSPEDNKPCNPNIETRRNQIPLKNESEDIFGFGLMLTPKTNISLKNKEKHLRTSSKRHLQPLSGKKYYKKDFTNAKETDTIQKKHMTFDCVGKTICDDFLSLKELSAKANKHLLCANNILNLKQKSPKNKRDFVKQDIQKNKVMNKKKTMQAMSKPSARNKTEDVTFSIDKKVNTSIIRSVSTSVLSGTNSLKIQTKQLSSDFITSKFSLKNSQQKNNILSFDVSTQESPSSIAKDRNKHCNNITTRRYNTPLNQGRNNLHVETCMHAMMTTPPNKVINHKEKCSSNNIKEPYFVQIEKKQETEKETVLKSLSDHAIIKRYITESNTLTVNKADLGHAYSGDEIKNPNVIGVKQSSKPTIYDTANPLNCKSLCGLTNNTSKNRNPQIDCRDLNLPIPGNSLISPRLGVKSKISIAKLKTQTNISPCSRRKHFSKKSNMKGHQTATPFASKFVRNVNSFLFFLTNHRDASKQAVKQFLLVIVVITWCPCIFFVSLWYFLHNKPLTSKHNRQRLINVGTNRLQLLWGNIIQNMKKISKSFVTTDRRSRNVLHINKRSHSSRPSFLQQNGQTKSSTNLNSFEQRTIKPVCGNKRRFDYHQDFYNYHCNMILNKNFENYTQDPARHVRSPEYFNIPISSKYKLWKPLSTESFTPNVKQGGSLINLEDKNNAWKVVQRCNRCCAEIHREHRCIRCSREITNKCCDTKYPTPIKHSECHRARKRNTKVTDSNGCFGMTRSRSEPKYSRSVLPVSSLCVCSIKDTKKTENQINKIQNKPEFYLDSGDSNKISEVRSNKFEKPLLLKSVLCGCTKSDICLCPRPNAGQKDIKTITSSYTKTVACDCFDEITKKVQSSTKGTPYATSDKRSKSVKIGTTKSIQATSVPFKNKASKLLRKSAICECFSNLSSNRAILKSDPYVSAENFPKRANKKQKSSQTKLIPQISSDEISYKIQNDTKNNKLSQTKSVTYESTKPNVSVRRQNILKQNLSATKKHGFSNKTWNANQAEAKKKNNLQTKSVQCECSDKIQKQYLSSSDVMKPSPTKSSLFFKKMFHKRDNKNLKSTQTNSDISGNIQPSDLSTYHGSRIINETQKSVPCVCKNIMSEQKRQSTTTANKSLMRKQDLRDNMIDKPVQVKSDLCVCYPSSSIHVRNKGTQSFFKHLRKKLSKKSTHRFENNTTDIKSSLTKYESGFSQRPKKISRHSQSVKVKTIKQNQFYTDSFTSASVKSVMCGCTRSDLCECSQVNNVSNKKYVHKITSSSFPASKSDQTRPLAFKHSHAKVKPNFTHNVKQSSSKFNFAEDKASNYNRSLTIDAKKSSGLKIKKTTIFQSNPSPTCGKRLANNLRELKLKCLQHNTKKRKIVKKSKKTQSNFPSPKQSISLKQSSSPKTSFYRRSKKTTTYTESKSFSKPITNPKQSRKKHFYRTENRCCSKKKIKPKNKSSNCRMKHCPHRYRKTADLVCKRVCFCRVKRIDVHKKILLWFQATAACVHEKLKKADLAAWKPEMTSCDNLYIEALSDRPMFWFFRHFPNCYPAFLSFRKSCRGCTKYCILCCALCSWCPLILCCYSFCRMSLFQ